VDKKHFSALRAKKSRSFAPSEPDHADIEDEKMASAKSKAEYERAFDHGGGGLSGNEKPGPAARAVARLEKASARVLAAHEKVAAAKAKYEGIVAKNRKDGIAPKSEDAVPENLVEFDRANHEYAHKAGDSKQTYHEKAGVQHRMSLGGGALARTSPEEADKHIAARQAHADAANAHREGADDADALSAKATEMTKAIKPPAAAKEKSEASVETGPRGGRYVTTKSGAKVYVKK
jgi:hypothetical protein